MDTTTQDVVRPAGQSSQLPQSGDRATVEHSGGSSAELRAELAPTIVDTTAGGSQGEAATGHLAIDHDRFRIDEEIGAGGMGRVFKAFDQRLERYVALKLLRTADPEHARRLQREAKAQASVDHPRVCKVFEVGTFAEAPYIVMQYIDGVTLDHAAAHLTVEQIVRLLSEVCDGVHAAHRLGLIHRDIKPANILVEQTEGEPRAYVLDFGLAKEHAKDDVTQLTRVGVAVGTPAYMAPEQVKGQDAGIDPRTDVYSIGATLYRLLTGKRVISEGHPIEMLRRVLDEEPPSLRSLTPTLSRDLETVVLKAIEKSPDRRYPSASALAQDLRRYLDGEPVFARRPTLTYRLLKKLRKHRTAAVFAGVALVASAGFGGWALNERLTAEARAGAQRQLAREVERLEWMQLASHQLPLHDVRPDRARLRMRIANIETMAADLGRAARGPGAYALGRSYLALQHFDEAREYLERALALDYDTPEVTYSLGRALAEIYIREEALADATLEDAEHDRRDAELRRDLLEPALRHLRQASADGPQAALIEARIAQLEGDHEVALAASQRALAERPWLYEAKLVESDVHATRALDAEDRSAYDEAYAGFDEAERALLEALEIAPSDPLLYARLCRVGNDRMRMAFWKAGDDSEPFADPAQAACEKALQCHPDHVETLAQLARHHHLRAERSIRFGTDPTEPLRLARTYGERAVELAPDDPDTLRELALVEMSTAEAASQRGDNSRPHAVRAMELMERVAAIRPQSSSAHHTLGIAQSHIGRYEESHGGEFKSWFEKAVTSLEKAHENNPQSSDASLALSTSLRSLGWALERDGEDPRPTYHRAATVLRDAMALEPDLGYLHNNLAVFDYNIGRYELRHGTDAQPSLERAIASFRAALARVPDDAFAHFNIGHVHALLSKLATWRGEDPRATARESIDSFRRGIEFGPAYAGPYASIAQQQLVRARYLRTLGRSYAAELDDAVRGVEESLRRNPSHLVALRAAGELATFRAEEAFRNGSLQAVVQSHLDEAARVYAGLIERDPDPRNALGLVETAVVETRWRGSGEALPTWIAALEAIDAILEANARDSEAHLARGRLLAERTVQLEPGPQRSDLEVQSRRALERARTINGHLARLVALEESRLASP